MIIDILLLIGILILIIGICFLPVPFIYLRYFIKHCYEYYKEKPTYIKTVGDLIHHSHEITKIWIDDFNVMPIISHILLICYIIHDLCKFIFWLIPKICYYIYVLGEKTYINTCINFIWKWIKYIFIKLKEYLYICCYPLRLLRDRFINFKEKIYEIKLQ